MTTLFNNQDSLKIRHLKYHTNQTVIGRIFRASFSL